MSTTTTMLQLMLKMQKRSSDDEFSKQEKVKVSEKSKGYMYIVFILRALLIFYTRIQYLWYTQSIYFYFIFFLSLCFIFLHYSSVKLFSSFRPVLECTNFSITWCSRQKRVLTICFISRTQVLIGEHTFMELWNALQMLFLNYFLDIIYLMTNEVEDTYCHKRIIRWI